MFHMNEGPNTKFNCTLHVQISGQLMDTASIKQIHIWMQQRLRASPAGDDCRFGRKPEKSTNNTKRTLPTPLASNEET